MILERALAAKLCSSSLYLFVSILVGGSAWTACSSTATCADDGTCEPLPRANGRADGDAGDGGAAIPEGCELAFEPEDAPKCVVDEVGVFVDGAAGSDSNPGTKTSPMKTIGAALGKLAGRSHVYLCGEGPYVEGTIKLTGAVSLYGGFSCGSWESSGPSAKIAPTTRGIALTVSNATKGVVLSDLEVIAKDGVDAGESSIGLFISKASSVTLRRLRIEAGKGIDGANGVSPGDILARAPDGTPGANGGTEKKNTACPTSIGGAGGSDTSQANGIGGKTAIVPVYPDGASGAGGITGGTCATGLGLDGSYGVAGDGAPAQTSVGALAEDGWKPSDGNEGSKGGDGQGGGGGAKRTPGGVGGSGGAGGCGGVGGGKGQAGGASIALAIFESSVSLETTSLVTKDAGKGGDGGKGQKGQLGSATPAVGTASNSGCTGGVGGGGGSGGGGGGGAGGLSVGILYKGSAPKIDGSDVANADSHASTRLGAKGGPGALGSGGTAADAVARAGKEGFAGADGMAKAVMTAP